MFPLGNPIVPCAAIPLHVFEDRYRRLMDDCLAADRQFGIVMIERGSEVGGDDTRTSVGTLARIVDANEADDGRWLLIAVGTTRIRVIEWLPDDPYPRAIVETIDEVPLREPAGIVKDLQRRVRRISALRSELGDPAAPVDVELHHDPVAAGFQAVAVGGLGPFDVQRILETDDTETRLRMIGEALDDAEELLRLRIAG